MIMLQNIDKRQDIGILHDRYRIGRHKEGKEMNNTMAMSRSCEEVRDLLREGESLGWVKEYERVDCAVQVHPNMFDLLLFLQ